MTIDQDILGKIRANDPGLTSLDLKYADIDKNDIITLADALKTNHILTLLNLESIYIDVASATALAGALKDNRSLTALGLRENNIGSMGATALADALKENCSLTSLYLPQNTIGDAGAIALANALKGNRTLAELNLWHNSIHEDGANALADAFIISPNIVFVDPATEELEAHCRRNTAIAKDLIEKIQNNPGDLTRNDRQQIQERIPAILYVGDQEFNLSKKQTLGLLADVGIKPHLGPTAQRINVVREEQRRRALEEPDQGI